MNQFTIRPYCEETDFETFYEFHCAHAWKTIVYQLSGASPCIPKEKFRESLQKVNRYSRHPFVVADVQNHPIGYALIEQYVRVANHQTFQIVLWEQPELTEQVLRQTLETIFEGDFVEMAICRVNGNEQELLTACSKISMKEVGCIPKYFCYKGDLYSEYTFIINRDEWKCAI